MSGSNQLICRAAVLALLLCASGAEPAAADEATPRDFTFTFMRTTFSDDASSGKPAHLWSMDQLRAAGPEMENYFRLVSNGKLRLHVRVAEAPDLGPRASYVTGEAIENAALDSAHNAGYDAAITGTQALYFLERGYAGGNCNAYYGLHAVTHQMTALLGEMAVQEGCGRGSVSPDPAGRSGVDWSGFEQEVGHDLQHITGRAIIHPAGYGDSFNMMDSCYPCSESAFDLAPATVVGGNVAPFPGWLPSTKYSILTPTAAELATGGSRTVNLAPVEADPTTTPLAQGLKIPYAAIDVPVSATERWHGERYYMLSLHRRIRAGAYGPASSPRMADEGVEIHEVMESRNPPVQMVPPCEQAPAPVRCVYLPDAAHDGSYCDTHPSPPGPRLTECWPYVLWHPGDTYHGLAGTDISFGATTASGAQPVIVTRGRASGPDPFIIPDHSPPMNTAETVDLWIDSSCNGYEYSRRGHYYLRTNPSALRYGRRSAPTLEGETVVANGDDLCGNHENRIYARIHNAGNGTARDVRVKLGISRTSETPGAGAVWDEIGTTGPVDIPPHGVKEVFLPITPGLPLYRNALDLRADLSGADVGQPSTLHAEEHINRVEDPEGEALRRALERYAHIVLPIPPIIPEPGDPPYFDIRAETAPGSPGGMSLTPLAFTATPGKTTRVPLDTIAAKQLKIGQQFVLNLMTDRTHIEINSAIPGSWAAPPIHFDPQTVGQTALIFDVMRTGRLTLHTRRRGQLLVVTGRLTPAKRAPIAVDLLKGGERVLTRLVMTDRKGRFSLRVRRADARRLRAQAIFAGDRTTTHAIVGPQVKSALPPLPTPAAKLVGMPAFPAPLGAAAFGTATLTLACSALDPSSLVISGGLDPAASTVVEIGYTRPDGAPVVHDVATDANGGFSDTLATAPGQSWTAQATWGGDAKHVRASSQPCKDTSPQLPDLIISKVFQQNNDHSDVSFTVANQGAGDAGAFSVLVAQSNGQTSTSVPFSGLGAGQSASSQVGCKGGVITVTADDAHAVAETNEDNNAATAQLGC